MSRGTCRASRDRARGIALLLTLVCAVAMGMIVWQMQTGATVGYQQTDRRIKEQMCRRALDSVPGLAARMLGEKVADIGVDTLNDEWTQAKFFNIGDVRVEISIEDCARRFDLRSLLADESGQLEANRQSFVAFAVECGLDERVAESLALVIIREAEDHRAEDKAFIEQAPEAGTDEPAPTLETLLPIWLDDFMSLSELSEEERWAIQTAQGTYIDPVSEEEATVRLTDQVTIWRDPQPNINTASRQVLLHAVPGLQGRPDVVDEILRMRAEQPFTNVAQLGNVTGLTPDEVRALTRQVRLNSTLFRVTAVATLSGTRSLASFRKATMTLILLRKGSDKFDILWRNSSV